MAFVLASKLTTAANAVVIQYTSPAFVILFMWIIFKTRPKARDIVAAFVVVAGIAIFFFDNLSEGQMLGNIIAIFSGISFSLVFVSKQMKDSAPIESVRSPLSSAL